MREYDRRECRGEGPKEGIEANQHDRSKMEHGPGKKQSYQHARGSYKGYGKNDLYDDDRPSDEASKPRSSAEYGCGRGVTIGSGIQDALQRRSLTPLSVGYLRYSRSEIREQSLRRDEIQTHGLKRTRCWEQEGEHQARKDDERYLIGAIFAIANLIG